MTLYLVDVSEFLQISPALLAESASSSPRLCSNKSEALILVNRGYAATLNKKLQRLLSRYVAVVASSECKSSQRSACYHSPTTAIRTNPSRRITVKRCDQCQTLLGRDTSAASIILDIFKYHQSYGTLDLPTYCI